MSKTVETSRSNWESLKTVLNLLRCPVTGENLHEKNNALASASGSHSYKISESGIPLFAEKFCSAEGRIQQQHYDRVAASYLENLTYPHTQEYMGYLDDVLLEAVKDAVLDNVAEICCGRGEAFHLLRDRVKSGVGVDVSLSMLEAAHQELNNPNLTFIQGDATLLPLASNSFDSVFMLGGIHHVPDRQKLFSEVQRILKPGGRFYWREPVSDFFLWRWLRGIIYRLSPALDHDTERPLLYQETVPILEAMGLQPQLWQTCGFFGFCIFMNSDVLVFNRLFRFIPGIRAIARSSVRLDDWTVRLPGLQRAGLQVVGVAQKLTDRE